MADKPSTIPARITIQLRDGVHNLLAEGELRTKPHSTPEPVDPSSPEGLAGGRFRHQVVTVDIVTLLATALRDKWAEILAGYDGDYFANDIDLLEQDGLIRLMFGERASVRSELGGEK